MPLTHITKGVSAEDIVRASSIRPEGVCAVFNEPLSYFFYGRPAYRISDEGALKVEAACPYCFIFDSALINNAKRIHAFDTGAFAKRMYKHVMTDEMRLEDFSLELDSTRPNRIIASVFATKRAYFDGDTTQVVEPDKAAEPWEFHARAYLQLLASRGRNEPDDRICSIEVLFGAPVPLTGNLKAVVVPHTLWGTGRRAPWLMSLSNANVEILPYSFIPGRHPEHYHALLEMAVRDLYERWGLL